MKQEHASLARRARMHSSWKGMGSASKTLLITIMIQEKDALVITFDTGTAAFQADQYAMAHKIPARLISMPGQLQAGCGLALEAPPTYKDTLPDELKKADIAYTQSTVMKV